MDSPIVISDGRVFVSHIGYAGVPARLSIVSGRSSEDSGPLLSSYPDWSWHARGDCNSITSVYGLAVSISCLNRLPPSRSLHLSHCSRSFFFSFCETCRPLTFYPRLRLGPAMIFIHTPSRKF